MPTLGTLQVYTGEGKGKTTAAVGLAVRAAGAGMRVFFAQFLKNGRSSEFRTLAALSDQFVCRFFGRGEFLRGVPPPEEVALARQGLAECAAAIASGEYGLVILDEAGAAMELGLFTVAELLVALGRGVPATGATAELVVTGRHAPPELLAVADLITEMREIKHYATAGHQARRGLEY